MKVDADRKLNPIRTKIIAGEINFRSASTFTFRVYVYPAALQVIGNLTDSVPLVLVTFTFVCVCSFESGGTEIICLLGEANRSGYLASLCSEKKFQKVGKNVHDVT